MWKIWRKCGKIWRNILCSPIHGSWDLENFWAFQWGRGWGFAIYGFMGYPRKKTWNMSIRKRKTEGNKKKGISSFDNSREKKKISTTVDIICNWNMKHHSPTSIHASSLEMFQRFSRTGASNRPEIARGTEWSLHQPHLHSWDRLRVYIYIYISQVLRLCRHLEYLRTYNIIQVMYTVNKEECVIPGLVNAPHPTPSFLQHVENHATRRHPRGDLVRVY